MDHPPSAPVSAAARLPPRRRGWCAAEACRLEATAAKPGNVHPGASFPDLDHAELVAAGRAIAPALEAAPGARLGATILRAVTASRAVTRSNANLGIVLAIAPLAAVPGDDDGGPSSAAAVAGVLDGLGPADAADVWRAIAVAAPGGLGRRAKWDVAGPPPDDLRAAMAEAAPRDRIARLWTEGWQPLFDGLVNDLVAEIDAGRSLGDAIVRGYLRELARERDSLVARRHGPEVAASVSRRAAEVIARPEAEWRDAAAAFDRALREPTRVNPGTTADLCAAALYVVLRDGRLHARLAGAGRSAELDLSAAVPSRQPFGG